MTRPPVGLRGDETGYITLESGSASNSSRFSAIVLPVTVMTWPFSNPALSSSFITTGNAPGAVDVGHDVSPRRGAGRSGKACVG